MDKRSLFFILLLTLAFYLVHLWYSEPESKKTPAPPPPPAIVETKREAPLTPPSVKILSEGEEFFVLENDYQQLVFSSKGASLVEINLPLHSNQNKKSVIYPIEFDRILQETSPENDLFPAYSFYRPIREGSYWKKEDKGTLGGYYPLLRRPLKDTETKVASFPHPALQILSDNETEVPLFRVVHFDKSRIVFESENDQRKITKTFSFPSGKEAPYCFEMTLQVEGEHRNLWLSTGVPEVELISGNFEPAIKYRVSRGEKASVEKLSLPQAVTTLTSLSPDWIVNSNGFFGIILDPIEKVAGFRAEYLAGTAIPTRLALIQPSYAPYPASQYPGYLLFLPLSYSFAKPLHFRIFAGPFENDILKKVDAIYSDPSTGYNPHYTSAQSFHGWFSFISEPFAKFLFLLMKFFYFLTHSWGFSIILLTVALRIMLYSLNSWSIRSTLRMQEIAPQVKSLQEKYKKDPKKAQIEMVKLYREKGINPLTGCLPILIQMPFLIGMFDLLKSTFELRGVSFIPGWIDNLTAPDVLFSWTTPLFFIGNQFHLLPLLLGAVMFFQQKLSSPLPKDPSALTDQQKQQKMMGNIMAIVFMVMFYKFPSGLNIYWLSSMLLGMGQQWRMTKKLLAKGKKSFPIKPNS